MKRLSIILPILLALVACTKEPSGLTMLVGTYTDSGSKGIYSYSFDEATGEFSPLTVTEIANPSFFL